LYASPKAELKTKDRADLLEAFLGALYVDKGLDDCKVFCQVCFFPRLQDFILHQYWNDPKSKLQQCCLTLRTMDGGEPGSIHVIIMGFKYLVTLFYLSIRYSCVQSNRMQRTNQHARLYSCCLLPRRPFSK